MGYALTHSNPRLYSLSERVPPFDITCVRALFMFVSAWAALASAAVNPQYSLRDLTAASEMIVEGRVIRSWTAWDVKHLYIWTYYEVQIADVLKGSRLGNVTVSEPGGSVDDIHQLFSGTVAYAIGEQIILFLYRTPVGYLRTRGGAQGKVSVGSGASRVVLDRQIRDFVKRETH